MTGIDPESTLGTGRETGEDPLTVTETLEETVDATLTGTESLPGKDLGNVNVTTIETVTVNETTTGTADATVTLTLVDGLMKAMVIEGTTVHLGTTWMTLTGDVEMKMGSPATKTIGDN